MTLRRLRWRLLAAAALAGITLPAAASGLQVEPRGLDAAQLQASHALVAAVATRLPPVWRAAMPADLHLRWRDDLPAQVHGRSVGLQIGLRRELLDGWMARSPQAGDTDPAARAAQAALIHELAHVLDRGPAGGLSRDPRLLDLAGWQLRPLRFGMRGRHNPFTDRSPDRYELQDPGEFVAVNLEWFLLDPEYACRRPALARYFAARFDWRPPAADCAPGLVFLQAGADAATTGFEQIDPARVYAVDYLLAEGNEAPMSRWGHSMLRLVVCAPGRTPGPDCRLDLQYHRVLSFRAFVDDVQISSWRGLTGRYPSRLFLLPLDQVIDEYTQIELRGLRSIPLALQPGDIAGLLERAARLHWSYDGRYYFIDNNCAVETWRLLQDGVPRLAALPLRSITPTGLLRKLQRSGVADASVLADRDAALRDGYYFESAQARYRQMYALARQRLALPQPRLEDWLALPAQQRGPWLGQGDLQAAAALLLLEQAAQRRAELRARDLIKRRLLARGEGRAAHDQLRLLLADAGLLLRPGALGGEGYGLPQGERGPLQARAMRLSTQVNGEWARLRQLVQAALPQAQQHELQAIDDNLAVLGERLRRLNREQGGLELR
ncbi:DUF4105 domain-containing protein [Thermomonas fusca]|uniref:DUF4105 domain-containing protein n=1 Tax=Thermomonas fusca TaxID=215690 RepID=A0A5R9PEN5_9GAMM|nr:DUF4105 domain-containing protein [Thermomonas fusca]TLX21208.1 DUF4105 domain-containing protein [Thermomonas fusca]